MANKYPDQTTFFASWQRPKDVKALSDILIGSFYFLPLLPIITHRKQRLLFEFHIPFSTSTRPRPLAYVFFVRNQSKEIARRNTHAPELNVLVVGMPNVGKSTLLNALRNIGIPGRTSSLFFLFVITFHLAYVPSSSPSLCSYLVMRYCYSQRHQKHCGPQHNQDSHEPSRPVSNYQPTL